MRELPVPDAAFHDTENSVEMLRVWIADNGLFCSIKIGMYVETMDIPEEAAWGTILADAARHIADGLNKGYDRSINEVLKKIEKRLVEELNKPSSQAKKNFA